MSDADLAVTAQALRFAVTVLRQQTRVTDAVCAKFLPQAIALLKSPLLQGSALEALQAFFSALAAGDARAASFDALLATLRDAAVSEDAGRPAQHAAARCVAQLCQQAGQARVDSTAKGLLATLGDAAAGEAPRRFALLCLGELGRGSNLTALPTLPDALTKALGEESVAEAASLALGGQFLIVLLRVKLHRIPHVHTLLRKPTTP